MAEQSAINEVIMRGKTNCITVVGSDIPLFNFKEYYRGDGIFPTLTATKPMLVAINLSGGSPYYYVRLTSGSASISVGMTIGFPNQPCHILYLMPGETLISEGGGRTPYVSIYTSELAPDCQYKQFNNYYLAQSVSFPTKFDTIVAAKPTRVILELAFGTGGSMTWHVKHSDGTIESFTWGLTGQSGSYSPSWSYLLYTGDELICDNAVKGSQYANECTVYISD